MSALNKRNCITGVVVLVFFLVIYACSLQLQPAAALWPQLICVVGIVLSAANTIISGVKWKKEADQASVFPLNGKQLLRGVIITAVIAAWILAIPDVGFLVSSVICTGVLVLAFEPQKDAKHIFRDVVITLLFAVVLYALFALLGIRFPRGILI